MSYHRGHMYRYRGLFTHELILEQYSEDIMEKYITFEELQEIWYQTDETGAGDIDPEYDGIKLFPGMMKAVEDFKTWTVREDDVWIVTYMKAGTTWAQEIASCIMLDGDLEKVNKTHTSFRVLFLECNANEPARRLKNLPQTHKIAEELPSPRVLKSHLPGPLLPPQIWEKKPKIIYVIRNPKDLVVSCFFFSKMGVKDPLLLEKSFGEFFDEMLAGKTYYGPWWDHYLYFWKMRHDKNILLLRFEDMKRDLRGHVEKISRFLGKNLSSQTLDAITEHCTFANMKKNPMANLGLLFAKFKPREGSNFMRKGKVGDWKSLFTVAQNEAMDALIRDKLHGTGLTFDYD